MSAAKPRPRPASSRRSAGLLVLGPVLVAALGSCSDGSPPAAEPPRITAPASSGPSRPATAKNVTVQDTEQLRARADEALKQGRLLAPAGDNVLEYYLALRDRDPTNPLFPGALSSLQPYALIATEQAISREKFDEARRLLALMEKADPDAPALQRLTDSIDRGEQAVAYRAAQQLRAEDEARRLAVQSQELARERDLQLREQQRVAAESAARREAEQREAQRRAAEQQAAEQRAAQERTQADAVETVVDLQPVKVPPPRYPSAAERDGVSGQVVVEFLVESNGTVGTVRVISAEPAGIFDTAATDAIKRWRFQPVSSPVTARRSIRFSLDQDGTQD